MICVPESSRTIRIGEDGAPQILTSEAERSPPQERPQQFMMWIVTNIPGNNVHLGNEMFEYLPPLAIELDGKEFNKEYSPHFSPYLVFEQQERVKPLIIIHSILMPLCADHHGGVEQGMWSRTFWPCAKIQGTCREVQPEAGCRKLCQGALECWTHRGCNL